jgi:hypothetical protein
MSLVFGGGLVPHLANTIALHSHDPKSNPCFVVVRVSCLGTEHWRPTSTYRGTMPLSQL